MAKKIALVLNADSEEGWVRVMDLLVEGYVVIGFGKSLNRLESLRISLSIKYRDLFHTHECSLNSLDEIKTRLLWIQEKLRNELKNDSGTILVYSKSIEEVKKVIDVGRNLLDFGTIWEAGV